MVFGTNGPLRIIIFLRIIFLLTLTKHITELKASIEQVSCKYTRQSPRLVALSLSTDRSVSALDEDRNVLSSMKLFKLCVFLLSLLLFIKYNSLRERSQRYDGMPLRYARLLSRREKACPGCSRQRPITGPQLHQYDVDRRSCTLFGVNGL